MPTSIRFVALAVVVLLPVALSLPAGATWPPPAGVTREQLATPAFWPNDPGYGPRRDSTTGMMTGGQWEHWSWIPAENLAVPGFRMDEVRIGAGNNTDGAWSISIGDPRVLIAVLDSGINWENEQLLTQAAINRNELPAPQDATGATLAYDNNADGVLNILDYLHDPRVTCGLDPATRNRMSCNGADGMPNDPNRNRVFDAGDLIRTFSNGMDEDRNGYTDDISGWDFHMDDNDPYDDTRYGHGTGEARDSNAAGNDGIGEIGGCPRCQFVPLRAGDSFVTDVNDFAQAVVYATDLRYGPTSRVRVIQEALGTLNQSEFSLRAIDYAFSQGLLVVASAADENSRHHNMPGTANHTMYVHAVQFNGRTPQSSTTYLAYNNCTNYGGQLQLSTSGTGCSSQATGESSGHAGLLYSAAVERNLTPPLNAEEARQLFITTADDINVPESVPGAPMYNRTLYPSLPGWDQRFGYGRQNVRRMLEALRDGRVPPEVDITSPRWFTTLFTDRDSGRRLRLEGRIAAQRARSFDYIIEWARGIEPTDTSWQMLRTERNVTAPVTNMLADLDVSTMTIDNPGEVENRFTITVRIRATAHYDMPVGDVPGEARRVVYITRDPDLLPGWPIETRASGESSPHLVDLNGDMQREVVITTSDGNVHAYRANGTELPGFPTRTDRVRGMRVVPDTGDPTYLGSAAFSGATPAIDPDIAREAALATPGIADLDGDGTVEIVVATFAGTIYVWNHDGTLYGHGYPVRLPVVRSADTAPNRHIARGAFASPVLYDLNNDRRPEIIIGAMDGNLYVFDAADATRAYPGFPVAIHYPLPNVEYNRVFGPVGVGNLNGDNIPDLVVVSNERLPGNNNTGAIYAVHGDGTNHAGGPFHPNWPIGINTFDLLPMVGEGLSTAPPIADLDGDGRDEVAIAGNGPSPIVFARGVQGPHGLTPEPATLANLGIVRTDQRGQLSNWRSNILAYAVAFSLGSFGDLTGDGVPDFVQSGASLDVAINLAGGATRVPFDHLVGVWDGRNGRTLPGFPRIVEDYTFFMNPTIADVSGDNYAEVIIGTAGYYLHAFDACGREAPGFPHFTGQWIIPSPAVGNIDATDDMEVVTGTRSGFLYAWHTRGNQRTSSVQWPTFRHDSQNTGNYGTTLDYGGVRRVPGVDPISCPLPAQPDAGVSDSGPDAGTGDGGMPRPQGGCGCRTMAPAYGTRAVAIAAVLVSVFAIRRRRRRIA